MRNDLLSAMRAARATYPAIDLFDRDTFIANLAFVHDVITATPQLLFIAAKQSYGDLADYFTAHLEEERDHAAWLSEDLASAGDIREREVSLQAIAMAGSQYYLIYHVDPAALLGYMAALECFPAPLGQVEALERVHGRDLCRTLRYHATHDIDHGADVLEQIDKLDARRFAIVKQNAMRTTAFIRSAIAHIAGAPSCMA